MEEIGMASALESSTSSAIKAAVRPGIVLAAIGAGVGRPIHESGIRWIMNRLTRF